MSGDVQAESKRVSVFCCGVQKGGTTSFYAHLREHPDLSAPSHKELHFFDDESRDWNHPGYQDLAQWYPADDGARLRFDATPIYCFWPPALDRIRTYNSDARLIFLFRDPFERAWSQWCMEYARGLETLRFGDAIRDGRHRMRGLPTLARERRVYTYVERGFYGEQVSRALALFPRDQLLFLRSSDLQQDHVRTLARISDFLGVDPFPDTGPKHEHARPDVEYMCAPTAADRALFADLMADDLTRFARLTGLDISDWDTAPRQAPVRRPSRSTSVTQRWLSMRST